MAKNNSTDSGTFVGAGVVGIMFVLVCWVTTSSLFYAVGVFAFIFFVMPVLWSFCHEMTCSSGGSWADWFAGVCWFIAITVAGFLFLRWLFA